MMMMEFVASGLRLFSVNRIGQTLSAHSHVVIMILWCVCYVMPYPLIHSSYPGRVVALFVAKTANHDIFTHQASLSVH